ncbi:MAG TPA: PRTRC system ThiF family protein [Candidatus Angelobacter sp.]|nr:PRTRC system ThiF family protein [Candidatus Angelobacter sp.]
MSPQPTPNSTLEHLLPGKLLEKPVQVTVAGCGGTGAAIAAGLPLLHQAMLAFGHPHGLDVCFVDADKISATNCVRQPFCENEIGLYKSTVLATRINLFYGLGWRASTCFVDEGWRNCSDILISCVDTRKARHSLVRTHAYHSCRYWLDIGNNATNGQFILGQPDNEINGKTPGRLPTVAELFPEIIDPSRDERDSLPSCSAVEALTRQEPFINQSLANLALAMLARLFHHGRLPYHGGFVNLATGVCAAIPVNPAAWQRLFEANQTAPAAPVRTRAPRLRVANKSRACRRNRRDL